MHFRRALESPTKQCLHICHYIGLHRLPTAHQVSHEPQHYVFIFVAKGLQSCTPIPFLAPSGTAGEIIKSCCTVREISGTRLVVSPCNMRCQIRASVVEDHQRGNPDHNLLSTLFVTLGALSHCRSSFSESARKAPIVYFCIVIESACWDDFRYPICGSHSFKVPWVTEHV